MWIDHIYAYKIDCLHLKSDQQPNPSFADGGLFVGVVRVTLVKPLPVYNIGETGIQSPNMTYVHVRKSLICMYVYSI
jgi:hypothetical protein